MIVRRLGLVDYPEALRIQEDLVESGTAALLLLRHPPVVTAGRQADLADLRVTPEELARRGVGLCQTGRGGQLTYHGPDQLVAYPVLDLQARGRPDLHRYLRDLEEVGIRVLADYGLSGLRVQGRTGVWVRGNKLAAIGVRVRRWVAFHGIALNVGPDLSGFDLIVPCGIRDAGVTSLAAELGHAPPMEEVEDRFERHFRDVFGF
ncbi:MAG: lipoyl(octanoyl) transferase LipB [Candidatus Eremiobacterota bacterium]